MSKILFVTLALLLAACAPATSAVAPSSPVPSTTPAACNPGAIIVPDPYNLGGAVPVQKWITWNGNDPVVNAFDFDGVHVTAKYVWRENGSMVESDINGKKQEYSIPLGSAAALAMNNYTATSRVSVATIVVAHCDPGSWSYSTEYLGDIRIIPITPVPGQQG